VRSDASDRSPLFWSDDLDVVIVRDAVDAVEIGRRPAGDYSVAWEQVFRGGSDSQEVADVQASVGIDSAKELAPGATAQVGGSEKAAADRVPGGEDATAELGRTAWMA
jgi:hypothetical protein